MTTGRINQVAHLKREPTHAVSRANPRGDALVNDVSRQSRVIRVREPILMHISTTRAQQSQNIEWHDISIGHMSGDPYVRGLFKCEDQRPTQLTFGHNIRETRRTS